ncbi:MAG: EamA family transporter [Coriobacteriia bacterium]|nr:EamA family transporter [Coriobacteriia bacterium]
MPTAPVRTTSVLPLLSLAGAVLFWGTSFAATKVALDSFPPMTVIFLRMAVAAVAIVPFWRRFPKPEYRRGDWKLLLFAGLCIPCLYYLLEGYAVVFTTSSQAGVISAIVPLLVGAGAWLFLKERLGARAAVAIAVSLVGVAMLSFGGSAQESAPNPLLGNTLELLAMVSAAGSMLTVKHLSDRYDPWLLTGMQAIVGTVFFAVPALLSETPAWAAIPWEAWASVAYLGVFVSLGAFGLYNTTLAGMPAGRAALSINLIPVVALAAGWLVRGEELNALQAVACAVVVGAVVYAETGPKAVIDPGAATPGAAAIESAAPAEADHSRR